VEKIGNTDDNFDNLSAVLNIHAWLFSHIVLQTQAPLP